MVISASNHLKPDDLGALVVAAARQLGGRSTTVLLADVAQRWLSPIASEAEGTAGSADAESDRPSHPIDASAAGEAFRSEAPVLEAVSDGARLWLPILDSAERVGVLGTTLDVAGVRELEDWKVLAGLVGEMVVAKSRYGDGLTTVRRSAPVTLAAEMRWAVLPPLTYTSPDLVVSAILEPAYEIGGDTFDYAVNDGVAHVALFDAMGHGLAASRMADLAVGSYRHSRRRGDGLAAMVAAMDEAVADQFGDSRFVTGQIATLDGDGVVSALNAGHPSPFVYHRDGTVDELRCGRSLPLGLGALAAGRAAEPVETSLRPGDVVLFYTDGVTEARSDAGEFFGDGRLQRLVGDLLAAGTRPPEVLRRVVDALGQHGSGLRDDATLLMLGWRLGDAATAPAAPFSGWAAEPGSTGATPPW
jgi:hypothetical protein